MKAPSKAPLTNWVSFFISSTEWQFACTNNFESKLSKGDPKTSLMGLQNFAEKTASRSSRKHKFYMSSEACHGFAVLFRPVTLFS